MFSFIFIGCSINQVDSQENSIDNSNIESTQEGSISSEPPSLPED